MCLALSGAGAIAINERTKIAIVTAEDGKKITIKEGDWVSLDGTTGDVYLGQAKTQDPDPNSPIFAKFMSWPTSSAATSVFARMPTFRATPRPPVRSAPKASASAAPSTCSSPRTVCRWCRR